MSRLSSPFATGARATGLANGLTILPNPDPVLKGRGNAIQTYRELLSDAHIGGCVRRRHAAIKAMERGIEDDAADPARVAILNELFRRLPMAKIIDGALAGALYGYQPLEIMWEQRPDGILPADIVAKPPEWFAFGQDGELRFLARDAGINGVEVPPRKFLVASYNASYNNPYGVGDLSLCYWPAVFKRGGFRYWATFVEKYGQPWLVGKLPPTASKETSDKMLDSLEDMIGSAVATIPDDSSIEIVEAASRSQSTDAYKELLLFCRAEIAMAILGQNQTSEATSTLASATVGLEVAKDINRGLAEMLVEVFGQLIAWIYEINGWPGQLPRFAFWERESVDRDQADRDLVLTQAGLRFSRAYWQKAYSLQPEDIDTAAPPAPAQYQADFAEHGSKADPVGSMVDDLLKDWSLDGAIQPLLDEIKRAQDSGESAQSLLERLPALAELFDVSGLTDRLTLGALSARAQGADDVT